VIVRFGDIGGIVDHHYLHFLFIKSYKFMSSYNIQIRYYSRTF